MVGIVVPFSQCAGDEVWPLDGVSLLAGIASVASGRWEATFVARVPEDRRRAGSDTCAHGFRGDFSCRLC